MQLKSSVLSGALLNLLLLSTQLSAQPPAQDAGKTDPTKTPGVYTPPAPQLYTFPGFVFQRQGEWIGSDYLYNLQNDIGLVVEVLLPENENIEVDSGKLTELAINAFRRNKLIPRLNPAAGPTALPFFYIQVMIFPTELGNVAMVSGSLFEGVTLARIPTQPNTVIQGITWEKKTMFMSTRDNFLPDLAKTVEDVSNTFGERWQLFDQMKSQIGGYDNTSTNPLPKATKPQETRHPTH